MERHLSLPYEEYKAMEGILRSVGKYEEEEIVCTEQGQRVGYYKIMTLRLAPDYTIKFIGPTKREPRFRVGDVVRVKNPYPISVLAYNGRVLNIGERGIQVAWEVSPDEIEKA